MSSDPSSREMAALAAQSMLSRMQGPGTPDPMAPWRKLCQAQADALAGRDPDGGPDYLTMPF